MKFRYLGKKDDMKVFGSDFSGGKTPDVTDEKACAKLSGNRHFEAVKETKANQKPVGEVISQVNKAATETALAILAEGEERTPVLEAIEKRKNELASK